MAATLRHFSINADDLARSKAFYETVLGWTHLAAAGLGRGQRGADVGLAAAEEALRLAGTIEAAGAGGVTIKSALDNAGVLVAAAGSLTVQGSVTGAGKVTISAATADFASSFGQNVAFGATGVLELGKSQSYAGTITGFSKTGTTSLDLVDIGYVKGTTTPSYVGTKTSGTLTVKDGAEVATIRFAGNYLASKWTLSSDGHGGTKVVDPGGGTPSHGFIAAAAAGFGARAGAGTALSAEAWRELVSPALAMPGVRIA